MDDNKTPLTGFFALEATAGARLRPMSELADVVATLDEIDANAAAADSDDIKPVAALNAEQIWSNYNRNKGTPVAVHRRRS